MSDETRRRIQAIAEVVVGDGLQRMQDCGVPMELVSTGLYFLLTGLRISLEDPETGTAILDALYEGDSPDDTEAARSVKALRMLIKAAQVEEGNGNGN